MLKFAIGLVVTQDGRRVDVEARNLRVVGEDRLRGLESPDAGAVSQ